MTAHALQAQELLTIEQFEGLPESEGRFELVKGRLVEMGETTWEHSRALTEFLLMLRIVLPKTSWDVFLSGCGVAVDRSRTATVRIPDVFVLRKGAGGRKTKTFEPADVLLAVEVISSSTTKTDRVDKRGEYERAGVANYWIVDVRAESRGPKLVVLRLVDGQYQEQACGPDADGEVVITDLAGSRISFNWADLVD